MIEHIEKRALALLLAVLLVFSMVPVQASAYGTRTETASMGNLGISVSIPTENGGGADLGSFNLTGNTIVATAKAESNTDDCTGITTYNATQTIITFTNNASGEAMIRFDFNINGGTLEVNGVEQATSGSYATGAIAAGGTLEVKLYSPESGANKVGDSGSLTLTNLEIIENNTVSVVIKPGTNGTVKVKGTAISADTTVTTTYVEGVAVTATPASGYKFIAWVDETNTVVSAAANTTLHLSQNATVRAYFVTTSTNGYWLAGSKIHTDLENAIAAAQAADGMVRLLDSTTLTKSVTIPAGVTVVIPCDTDMIFYGENPVAIARPNGTLAAPTAFRTLTMADGVVLTVYGSLEASARHYVAHGGKFDGGRVIDKYGFIKMNTNSRIDVQSGGKLFAWGYISGSGKVNAYSGATVYEKFQVADYRGGGITSIIVPAGVFPFNQYYVQNVEVPETIHGGATLICNAGIYGSEVIVSNLEFIGTNGMFNVGAGSTATKRYDAASDRLIIDVDGQVALNSISLMDYNTANFILPINHNITVNINSGITTINQDLLLQPGAEVNVDRDAYLALAPSKKVYLMDADNWGNYCFGATMRPIYYTVANGTTVKRSTLSDAKVNLNGTAVVQGQLYASTAGAQVVSTGKTGVVVLMNSAPSGTTNIKQSSAVSAGFTGMTTNISMGAALLTNADTTTVNTKGAAQYTTYVYDSVLDKWVTTAVSITPTLTYNANGGNGADRPLTINYQNTALSRQPLSQVVDGAGTFTREGAVFTGWNTAADGSGKAFAPGDFITISQNTTLFAQWRNTSATVSFAANAPEGTTAQGQMNSQTLILDENGNSEFEVPACGYTVEGYTFDGWLGSDGNYYVVGQVYTVSGDLTLTAQWTKSSVVITFNANAPAGTTASGAMADQFAMEGDKLSTNAFAVTGYTFVGWNTKADGSGTAYADAATAPTENTTLYAQWKINSYTITYVVDGTQVHQETYEYKASVTAWSYTVPEGYSFSGWDAEIPATMPCEDLTFNGSTAVNYYTITWNVNNELYLKETYAYGATITVPTYDKEVPYGHEFNSWSVPETMPAEDIVLDAYVIPSRFTIVLDFNGGMDCDGDETQRWSCVFGSEMGILNDDLLDLWRNGYTFAGWNTDPNGLGEDYFTHSTVPGHDLVLYAQWTPDMYKYTWKIYVLDESGNKTLLDTVVLYEPYDSYPEFYDMDQIPEGYEFVSSDHFNKPVGTGNNEGAVYVKPKEYNITWTVNGEEFATSVVKYGEPITLPETDPEVDSYRFDGWLNVPATMPASDLTIEAIMTELVTINFYRYDVDADEYVFDYEWTEDKGTEIDLPYFYWNYSNTLGWDANDDGVVDYEYNETIIANEDLTLKPVLVPFYADVDLGAEDAVFADADGNPITRIYAENAYINEIILTNHPTRVGYTFLGWLVDGSENLVYTNEETGKLEVRLFFNDNCSATALWKINTRTVTFTVNGEYYDEAMFEYGQSVTAPEFEIPEGYSFSGWTVSDTMPAEDITLDAALTVNTYTVTFTVNGEYYAKAEVKYGQIVTAPEYVIPEGHSFSGWTVPDTMPAKDITLDAALTVNVYELSIFVGDHVDENGVCYTEISLQVPYGALLKDYLVETPDFIANTDDRQGKYTFAYWHTYASNVALDTETATMPANYIRYYATYDYTGWYIEEGGKYFVDHYEPIVGWFCVNDKNELVTDGSGDWYYIDPYRDYTNTGVSRAPYPAEAINGITYAPDQEFMDYCNTHYGYFIDEKEAWFIFDEDGKFQYAETGMGTYLDETRYAVNGMLPWHVGLVQIGEDYYYFIGDTEIGGNIMATGNVSMIRNNTDLDVVKSGVYTYGADGKLLKADGITDVNGTLYYYEDYQLMIGAGLIKIDEDYYYVRSNGALVVNSEYWVGGNSFGIAQGMHWFDENGKLTMLGYANVDLGAEDAVFVDAEGNPITCIYAESAVDNNITLTNHPTRVGYTFLGWLVDGSEYLVYTNEETGKQEVSLHLEYNSTATALWEQDVYTITFEDGKGNVLLSEGYTYGQMPTAPANPTRADEDGYKFVFAGWSPAVVEATEDAVYTATWTKTRITYSVSFDTDGDGTIDAMKTVAHGDVPEAPAFSLADTAEWDYTFTGWRDSDGNTYTTLPAADGADVYTAIYTAVKQTYEITWIIDGASETTTVEYGAMPTHADPSKAETAEYTYTFAGWSPKVVAVTGEATYTAAFTAQKRSYEITWIIDGASETTTVEYGVVPTHADPSKAETAEYTYTFAGWSPEVKAVTGEATYTAEFTAQKRSYEITWIIDGASETTIVEYGVVPTHADPSKAENAQYTYTFAGWSPEVVAVTGEATYTANFTPVLRSYDITFVVDGVEKVVSTKYGETPVYDADGKLPEKAADACYSYTFAGWTPALEAVTGEATYTATWTEIPVEHTITFMEGDEIIGMITGNYGDAVDMTKVPATDRLGYTFNGWNTMIPDTIPAEDLVINGSWTINQYTITFANDPADDKGEWSYPITKNFGEAITEADIAALNAALPTVTGWEIVGWSDEIPEFMPAHDTAIYAIWEKSVYLVDIYGDDSMGGTLLTGSTATYGETYETFEIFNASNDFNTDLVREGYVLVGYKYFDGTDVTFPFVQPAHDVQMVAQYVPVEYTIDFMDGDELVTSITAGYGTAITLPENPTKEGFTFAGWVDADGNAVDLSTMPLNGMTVYASWTVDSFKLNFFATEGDTTAYTSFDIPFGTELTDEYVAELLAQIAAPEKEGHEWNGWSVAALPETMPASGVNVYGEWTANTYTIYWNVVENVNGETMGEFSVDFQFGSAITAPEYTAPAGYEVVDVQSYPATMPAEALYLQITIAPKTYTVTFDSCGGTSVDSISAAYKSAITAPAAPTKTGHIFMGWSVDGETVIDFPATMPIDGLNLKAVWQKDTVYITFIIEGVETVKAFAYGDAIVAPEATKAADAKWTYKFVGWDADLPAFATETTTYTALFAEDEAVKYNVKFVDGENVVFETQIAWNDVVTLDGFTAPELTGNTLAWTVDGAAASFPYAMTTADVTFVASWTPITYTVYYYTVDGFENGEAVYTAQATYGAAFPTYTLTLPEGYDFGYWADANGNAYDLPETMPAQDLHLIAQLTPKTFTVTWHYGYDEILEETYAYGATVNGFIPERFYMNTEIHRGWFDHVWWYNMHTSENIDIPFTMPAENLSIGSATKFTGWMGNPNYNYFYYIADYLTQHGWFCVNDKNELVTDGSGEWYYAGDDANVVSDITEIEGVYYAFDHNTGAFLGDYTGIYEALNGDKYFVENGIAVKNKGLVKDVLADGHIHYYYFGCADETCTDALCGGEYKAQRGCGHWAEITNGYLVKWGYVFDEDGVIIHDEDTSKNGVHLDNGVKFYYIDGVKVHKGLFIGDDNEYYYARSDGSLVVDRDYWISESHTNGLTYNGEPIVEGSYTFDAEGRIVWPNTEKNGVYMEGGKLYYYEAGLRTYAGLIRYTGSLYNENGTAVEGVYNNDLIYVRGSGELAIGKYWPTKTNGLMDSNTYQFDKNGKMMMLSGIIAEDGSLYYYEDGLRTYAGLIEINGDFYYVRGTGEVVNGRSYWITKTNGLMAEGTFQFAEDGKMIIPEPVAVKNGIYREDGKLYYYVDGKLNYAGLIRYTGSITEEDGTVIEGVYDNAYIYVRGTGELAVGSYWTTKHNDLMKSATHQFDENGIMTDPAV